MGNSDPRPPQGGLTARRYGYGLLSMGQSGQKGTAYGVSNVPLFRDFFRVKSVDKNYMN